jgi:hypothetical protein
VAARRPLAYPIVAEDVHDVPVVDSRKPGGAVKVRKPTAGKRSEPEMAEKATGAELVPVVTLPKAIVAGLAVTVAGGVLITAV